MAAAEAGVHAASGNVAISLHADTILPGFEIDRIIDVFSTIIRLLVIYLLQRIWGTPDVAGMYKKYYTLN